MEWISCAAFFIVTAAVVAIIAPIWIVAHYLTRWRTARSLSRDDEKALVDLWEAAKRMERRIENLERVLDAEAPDWRRSNDVR
jgi:phage shock protein B